MRMEARQYPGHTDVRHGPILGKRFPISSTLLAFGTLFAGVVMNTGEETKRGAGIEPHARAVAAFKDLAKRRTIGGFIETAREQACEALSDISLHHTLFKSTPEGPDEFNMFTFLFPLQVKLSRQCSVDLKIGVRVPYIFAKTFREIAATDDEARNEILKQFAEVWKSQLSDELIVRGIEGVTENELYFNSALKREGSAELSDRSIIVKKAKATGLASDEANVGENAGARSLGVPNPENEKLAADRLNEILEKFPVIMEAARIPKGQIDRVTDDIEKGAQEMVLAQQQIAQLARIAEKIQALQFQPRVSIQEKAYRLIQEHNAGNPDVLAYLEANPVEAKEFEDLILASRGVTLKFELQSGFIKHDVFTMIPLPLLLLLLVPTITIERRSPMLISPSTLRRIFAGERNPDPNKPPPPFEEAYASLPSDSPITPQDISETTKMFIVDEVAPSFEQRTYTGFSGLDYARLISLAMNPYVRDSYLSRLRQRDVDPIAARAEAIKSMTKDLARMWDEHDRIFTYSDPERERLLPYERSTYVLSQAKALAEYFVWHIDQELKKRKGEFDFPSADKIKEKILAQAKELIGGGFLSRTKLLLRE